jgi:hypothetical protein
MNETPRRRITVTSSLIEISRDQLGNMKDGCDGGRRYSATPIPFYSMVSGQIYKDDMNFPLPRIFASCLPLILAPPRLLLYVMTFFLISSLPFLTVTLLPRWPHSVLISSLLPIGKLTRTFFLRLLNPLPILTSSSGSYSTEVKDKPFNGKLIGLDKV